MTDAEGTATSWLRDLAWAQRYETGFSDAVITDYRSDALGLSVQVTDVVARGGDVLVRRVGVRRDPSSPVTRASLVAFEDMNLVVSKYAQFPIQDRYSSTWRPWEAYPPPIAGGAPATCG
ncbi:MAG: hypothetical protein E6J55_24410 [Deltaproteobacteria bacterium]|nr:MAG: hypothetical protein E6J55_24410 [Deltaproteobacteria bacterium]